ncbi:MAG: hypothetical protein ACP5UR_17050 [Chloroflexus sp.]|uniref:hypothetical protein n=1 Tax=Chloroflexus sp. TaxID=1904827 RepID=UPI003D13DEB6
MKRSIFLIVTGVGMTLLGLSGMAFGGWFFWHAGGWWQEVSALLVFLASFILFGAGLWATQEGFIATAVAQRQVTVEPLEARLGQDLNVQAILTPRRTLQAGPVVFTLVGRERIRIRQSHRWIREKTAEPVNLTTTLAEAVTLLAGHPQTYTARLTVPPEAMPSFSRDESLGEAWAFEWFVRFRLGLPRLPDVEEEIPIRVVPVRVAAGPLEVLPEEFGSVSAPQTSEPLRLVVDRTTLTVGDVFSGRVAWQGELGEQPGRGLRVELGYRALAGEKPWERRRWEHVAARMAAFEPTPGREWPFTLTVPLEDPITYTGALYRVEWFVRAVLDRPLMPDVRVELPVQVLPRIEEGIRSLAEKRVASF